MAKKPEYTLPMHLRDARIDEGLSQEAFGEKFGASRGMMTAFENGVSDMSSKQLFRLCLEYNLDASHMLGLSSSNSIRLDELDKEDALMVRQLAEHLRKRKKGKG